MSLHIVAKDVTDVLIAGEWFDVDPGTFRVGAYQFANTAAGERPEAGEQPPLYGSGHGFEFVSRKSGDVFAGPLASITVIRRRGEEPTAEGSLQRLATMLRGQVDGKAVHFAHAGRLFQVQFGPKGWVCASRDGGNYASAAYALREDDRPEELVNQVMSDLKGTFGLGR